MPAEAWVGLVYVTVGLLTAAVVLIAARRMIVRATPDELPQARNDAAETAQIGTWAAACWPFALAVLVVVGIIALGEVVAKKIGCRVLQIAVTGPRHRRFPAERIPSKDLRRG